MPMQRCVFLPTILRIWTEVREAIECVVNDTYRAGDIIGGIRDQVKKSAFRARTAST